MALFISTIVIRIWKMLSIKVELFGGLEVIFGKATKLDMVVEEGTTVEGLINKLCTLDSLDQSKIHLFRKPGHIITPGILITVNSADLAIYEKYEKHKLENSDTVAFISTLHGG
ncbi:Ubiquitin- modifier 1 [Cichlidogyrus casuarinus]|uniref:Ubiquitin-related modifier 1 n=1 Tax=Cichlidogyrus casuarinus TaxID=1844966 RepID=A0ABD2QBL3_9PLAT